MATRLYFHAASSTVSGTLPSAEQSSRTATLNVDAGTVNRSMDISIGAGQTVSQRNTSNATDVFCYYTKFISQPLNLTSVSANTWTYNFAYKINNTSSQTGPVKEGATNPKYSNLPITFYIWRPSTGAKIGNIMDGDTPGTSGEYFDCTKVGSNELVEHGTLSGSAVTCQVGDVIVFEVWTYSTDITARTNALNWYYDGTTTNTTNETIVSNHASFLETPQNLTFTGSNQNKTATLNETLSVAGPTNPGIKRDKKRTGSDTLSVAGPTNPGILRTKNRTALDSEFITFSDAGQPTIIKAKNVSKTLSETLTLNSSANPPIRRTKFRAISETLTLNSGTPTYIQHPNRIKKTITETLSAASTLVKKSAKRRILTG